MSGNYLLWRLAEDFSHPGIHIDQGPLLDDVVADNGLLDQRPKLRFRHDQFPFDPLPFRHVAGDYHHIRYLAVLVPNHAPLRLDVTDRAIPEQEAILCPLPNARGHCVAKDALNSFLVFRVNFSKGVCTDQSRWIAQDMPVRGTGEHPMALHVLHGNQVINVLHDLAK